MSIRSKERPSVLKGMVILLLGLGLAFGVYYYVAIRPWVAPPDDAGQVAEAWGLVEVWAHRPSACSASSDGLDQALEFIEQSWAELSPVLRTEDGDFVPTPYASLPLDGQRALDALLSWQQQGGGFGERPQCEMTGPEVIHAGVLVVATGMAENTHSQTVIINHLADRLAQCGSAIDLAMSAITLEWTQNLGGAVVPDNLMPETAFFAMARDAICQYQQALEWVQMESGTEGIALLTDELPAFASLFLDGDRELLMLRRHTALQLANAFEDRHDPHALPAHFDQADNDLLPKSALVRLMGIDLSSVVERWIAALEP